MRKWSSALLQMRLILFVTFMTAFLLLIITITSVYNWNMESIFSKYEEEQTRTSVYKLMDDMRGSGIVEGPFTEEQRSWLLRRVTLYGLLVRYEDPEQIEVWFDNITPFEHKQDTRVESFPLLQKGERLGMLSVAYSLKLSELDSAVVAYREMIGQRSRLLMACVIAIAIVISTVSAKMLMSHMDKLQLLAAHLRVGRRDVVIPVKGPLEIRRLAATLNELSQDLKKQEDWRINLMEDLTHELRTPITSMQIQLELIVDGVYKIDKERMQEIYDEMQRLSKLINDMELLSEAEGARFALRIKRVDMVKLCRAVYHNFLPMAKAKDIRLSFETPNVPCFAEVDHDKMTQVVSNIVSNAIKYTLPGGQATLGVDWTSEHTIIYCEDTGIGIGETDLPYIFNRLYRADKSRSRFSGGVGLGLSIVRALVEAHEGTIEVSSEPGIGSIFSVQIPNTYKSSI